MNARLRAAVLELARWTDIEQLEIAERIWFEIRQRDAAETSHAVRELIDYRPAVQVG